MNRLLKPLLVTAVAALLSVAAASCTGGENDGGSGGDGGGGTTSDAVNVINDGLRQLSGGAHYELWTVTGNNSPRSIGKIDLDSQGFWVGVGNTTVNSGLIDTGRDLSQVDRFLLTVEPAGDTDSQPSDSKLLAGPVNNESATLRVSSSAALGTDFASASGVYFLGTFTDGNDTSNETSGIWFYRPGMGAGEGLNLPSLPTGWTYEGWSVINGQAVSTGKFDDPGSADRSAPYSSNQASAPDYPGEDFLMNAPEGLSFPTDLLGNSVVISVEPEPSGQGSDPNAGPFQLKPLISQNIDGGQPGSRDYTNYPLSLNPFQPEVTPTVTININQFE